MVVHRRKNTMFTIKVLALLTIINCCVADIEVDSTGFKVYRQIQQTTQKNHVKLRFKTFHSTGLIMLAEGANKMDFISIELYRGKIRVAADYGRGTENSLRPIGGFYSMYLGKDLADNEWHTVEFIRNIRESILYIDRGLGKMEKSAFMKSPPTYNELSVSMITFGGFYSFGTSGLSTKKALSRKGIKACFSEATFSQFWPEDNSKKIDFVKTSSGMTTIGTIQNNCPAPNPPYKPIFFQSSAVHIALINNYTIASMKLSLMFRTVVADQTVANYTTIGTGERIQLRLDRKGRVTFGIDVESNMQLIETATGDYHDGQWHEASFEVDNIVNEDGSYLAKFTVGGKSRLSMLSSSFKFDGYVNIGFGFTGCMRDIKINDQVLEKVQRNTQGEYFELSDTGVIYNQCSLKDYCNPNPCQHGGKCNQTDDNIACDCRDTLYEGSTCHRARFNYTCAGVRKSGERRSDVYFIDFDGMGPMEPVRALCDLGRNIETTTTQINNTQYEDRSVLTTSGTNVVSINYAASITQMRELVMNSAFCEQLIKLTCKGTPIFQSPEGPPKVNWMGGDDILHYYWGGAKGQRGYCACGVTDTCANRQKYCNCDSLDGQSSLTDTGNLTIKEHLPVREVNFYKVLDSGARSSLADLLVGHLRCSGFGARDIAASFRKPWSFLSVDHPDQPFDNIFAGGLSFDFKTSVAFNYMVIAHAHGPFSGDYLKVMIWSRTMMRVHLNFGFGDIKQDVDISSIGRTIDDNEWHEFDLMFNLKELNVTLDGVAKIQGLPLQDDPVQFNVDDKAVYIGGSYHDKHGFVGCIRSLYVNGRIHDIRRIATGQEDYGVYPGCSVACAILNSPCNYGACIDEYDSFKCNCSVSPFDGKFCQNETYPKTFSGNTIVYDFVTANLSEPVSTVVMVVGFKTTEPNVALFQLEGTNDRHISLALVNGYLTLYYSLKDKEERDGVDVVDTETEILRIRSRALNNDKHNVAKVMFSTEEIYLYVPNYELKVSANVTIRLIDEANIFRGKEQDEFGNITKFSVGVIVNNKFVNNLPATYSGCMSGAKLVFHPKPTAKKRYRKSVEIDMFKLIEEMKTDETNPSGTFPTADVKCGDALPTPGTLPTVGPARQFFTRSPGLDSSVNVTTLDMANKVIVMVVIVVVAIVLLGFLYLIYRYVNTSHIEYKRLKTQEKPRPMSSQPVQSYQPHQSYQPQPSAPATVYQPDKPGASGGGNEDFFL